ncbi:MAG: hypothetical protein IKS54_06395 [Erysipelotrichaceae bacterium]|nr:hypothetical protein [Erysipelotrichaceae bacterium]
MKKSITVSEQTYNSLKKLHEAYNEKNGGNTSLDEFVELLLIDMISQNANNRISSIIRERKNGDFVAKRKETLPSGEEIEFS